MRVWDFEVRRNIDAVVERVTGTLVQRVRVAGLGPHWQRRLIDGDPARCAAIRGEAMPTATVPPMSAGPRLSAVSATDL